MSFSRVNYCDMFRAQGLDVCWYYKTDTTFFVKVISMSLIVSLGLVGNFFLAFVILSSKRLRGKSVNIFIVNLSISNCLNLSFTAPIIAVDSVTEFFELGDFICHAMRCVQVIFFVVPMLTLLVISVDRYLHIQNLMRDQNYTWKTFLVCLVIWGLGIGLGSSEYRYKTYSVTEFKDIQDKKCYDNYYKDGLDETNKWEFERIYWYVHLLLIYSSLIHIIRFSMLAVVFLIPFTGLLLFYTRILVKIRQIMGELAYHDQPHSKTLHNVTVMIITVLFTTMICWSPMTVFWFIKYMPLVPPRHEVLPANPNLKKPFGSSEGFRYIGETCIFLHCTLQPIIYFLTATNLRRGLGRWLPCIKIKETQPGMTTHGADTFIERAAPRYSVTSKPDEGVYIEDVEYDWSGGQGNTTEEDITSEDDAVSASQTPEKQKQKKQSKEARVNSVKSASLEFVETETPPNTPASAALNTNYLSLETLLLPAVLQRRLSRMGEL